MDVNQLIRSNMRTLLRHDSVSKKQQLVRHICLFLKNNPFDKLGAFWPMYLLEPDLRLFFSLLSLKKKIYLPRLSDNEKCPLVFLRWSRFHPLHQSPLGFYQPIQGEELIPDLLLIPLLAFKRTGERLGKGGGYYDRVLSTPPYKNVYRIGIGFSYQECEGFITTPKDQSMDWILTEKEIIKARSYP